MKIFTFAIVAFALAIFAAYLAYRNAGVNRCLWEFSDFGGFG
jgi:hypothetical protein